MKTFVSFILLAFSFVAIIMGAAVAHQNFGTWSSTKTRRLTVFYPTEWTYGDYRNCRADQDYKTLDCVANGAAMALPPRATLVSPSYNQFTIDVKFSGTHNGDNWGAQFGAVARDQSQSWTCQNDGLSLVCKN